MITNLKIMGFLALTMVLCLTTVGCAFNTQDAVILGLDAVEAAAGVAVAAGPGPAAAAVLQIIVAAVPTCIQIYQSSEPLAQKASDITAALGAAVTASGQLSADDQAILKATVGAVRTILATLQGLQALQAPQLATRASLGAPTWQGWQFAHKGGPLQVRTTPLTASEVGYLASIAKTNEGLRKKLAGLH